MNTMTRWLKRLLTPRRCDCEACCEREWKSRVEVARFNHPWRSSFEDMTGLTWWIIRAFLWSAWMIILVRATFNTMHS